MAKITILDGAMGTMLQAAGLRLGERPELFGMDNPEILEGIQRSYIEAGSDVIYTNTFGANAHKFKTIGASVPEVIKANVAIAKAAAEHADVDRKVRVALDVGPIGELMEPLGTLKFDEAYEIYKEMVVAGVEAGVDLVIFETMTDLYEVKAAVLAAKENSDLPVWVTMSFEENGRTFTGTTVPSMASTLEGLGVDAMGINCSLGPNEIYPMILEMREWTSKPIIVKPNAGLPDPKTGEYDMDADEFGAQMRQFADAGVHIMGGCCGTTPAFIAALSALRASCGDVDASREDAAPKRRGICSASHMTEFGGVRVIGERINPTGKKRFQQALREGDLNYIMERAIEQADAGADVLDINVGIPNVDEAALMVKVVKAVQSVVSLPLQIDSSDPLAIEAGLRACNGRAIVNSVNAEQDKIDSILPIVKKYGAAVVGLTLDKSGIPETADARFEMAKTILDAAMAIGIQKEDVLIDCLTLTISAQQDQAMETLNAVKRVHDELGLHCVLGVSNISFGLPQRNFVTTSFLTQAMYCGLDFPIINPNILEIMDTVASFKALSGQDKDCGEFIERFAGRTTVTTSVAGAAAAASADAQQANEEMTIERAVLKGLKEETAKMTEKLLEEMSEMDIINTKLIPALDVVGEKYEKQEIFLPQLINAANAACAGFELIKLRIAKNGGESVSKGKIVMCTVEGDIHDIGKNIVEVVLENYGYTVIDLGKDVPVQTVVDAVLREDAKLVGLSALMTTTVESMKRTIEAIRATGHECKIMVGGAVLTAQYADEIGADYYTRDAKASVDVAKEVLG
ncbi:MAG: homocysteine S-methyltransferase family protein [Clostridia bacterium]|nr:homocysteine S-methyltransferase family protein [Clostridia bacterium]